MKGSILKKPIIILVMTALSGCAYINPLISDFNIVSVAQEKEISAMAQQTVAQQQTLSSNTPLNAKVETIGTKLVAALPEPTFEYKFHVVEDATPNAFAIPGGAIYVHTGLMNLLRNDNELAGVMAHEVGHAYKRHPAKALSRQYGLQFLSKALLPENKGKLQEMMVSVTQSGIMNKYSRDAEREADEVGFYLLQKAGYPKDALLKSLEKLQSVSGPSQTPVFFRSHPATAERITRLKSLETQGIDITNGTQPLK